MLTADAVASTRPIENAVLLWDARAITESAFYVPLLRTWALGLDFVYECSAYGDNFDPRLCRRRKVSMILLPNHPWAQRWSRRLENPLYNGAWFQLTWFSCVLGREAWLPLSLALVAIHFLLIQNPTQELRRLAPVIALGIGVDSALSMLGVFDFEGSLIVPAWLCLLWIAFATTLNRALAAFGRWWFLAAVVGGLGVPFNYGVGAKFGAVSLPLSPWLTAVVLIAIWAILLPGFYRLAKRKMPVTEVVT